MLEMAEIERSHGIAKMECSCTNQQVFKRDPDAFGFLLAFYAAGQPRDVERYRMHGHILAQALDKG
jgi:hypothetical protein